MVVLWPELAVDATPRCADRQRVRAEFLNTFNSINFYIGNLVDAVAIPVNALTVGQTNVAYRDLSTTQDPGGRFSPRVRCAKKELGL